MSTTSISHSNEQELPLIMFVPQAPLMQQQHSLVRISNMGKQHLWDKPRPLLYLLPGLLSLGSTLLGHCTKIMTQPYSTNLYINYSN